MARGRALIHADRQGAHLRHLLADLHAEQHPAGAGLGALTDDDLDRIRHAQVLEVEAVARGRHLVDQLVGGLALFGQHAALAGAGREARAGEAHAESALGVRAQRAEAHRRQVDGEGQLERLRDELGPAAADPGLGLAVLAIALERQARHHARQEDEVVERRQLLERREAADLVAPELALGVDRPDRLGRPDVGAALVVAGSGVRNLVHQIFSQASGLRLLKYQSFCPETTLRNVNVPSTPFSRSRPCTRAWSSSLASTTSASVPSRADLSGHPDVAHPERVGEGRAGRAAHDQVARVRHERREVADVALDDQRPALERDAAARRGRALDVDRAAAHRRAGRHVGVALDDDLALGHGLAGGPADVALDVDRGAGIEAAAVVAHRAAEADGDVGGLPDAEVVARARILDHELAHALFVGQAAQLAVESLGPGVGVDHGRGALEIDAGGHRRSPW